MYIVTTMSFDALGSLIKNKKVSLDNGDLIFGSSAESIDTYFRERIGNSGYVIGIRGRLNNATATIFKSLDKLTLTGEHVILEADINPNDMIRYKVSGLSSAVMALYYGFEDTEIYNELDNAVVEQEDSQELEILCIPYIKGISQIKVTSLTDTLEFKVSGITFVKLKENGDSSNGDKER